MDKEVCINIKSVQAADEEQDVTELFTFGRLSRNDNNPGYQIYYEESDALGYAGCNVTLDVEKNAVTMTRRGSSNSCLIIEKGKKHHCHYGTPYGDIMIGINADQIDVNLDDKGGELYLKYTIDINSGLLSENEMFISVKENNKEERI